MLIKNKTVKKVIIHLGLHKTGTTSIQHALLANTSLLAKYDISYPKFNMGNGVLANHSWPLLSLFLNKPLEYHLNKSHLIDQSKLEKNNKNTQLELKKCLEKSSILLLSGEGLSLLKNEELTKLKSFLDSLTNNKIEFEFHYFTRSTVNFISSIIQERLKGGTREDIIIKDLVNSAPQNNYRNLNLLKDVFPCANITEHNFEKSCEHPGGPESYFIENILNIDTVTETLNKTKPQNSSLSIQSYELIKIYLEQSKDEKFPPINNTTHKKNLSLLAKIKGKKFVIHNRIQQKIIKEAINEKTNKSWETFFDSIIKVDNQDIWSDADLENIKKIITELDPLGKKIIINYFRDEAVRLSTVDLKLAVELMSIAKKFRPNGNFINSKYDEFVQKFNHQILKNS